MITSMKINLLCEENPNSNTRFELAPRDEKNVKIKVIDVD